ncbi:MAG: glycine oxidase [Cyclobacteriaceae bacterium]
MKKVDYLIVGQGIAGTLLALELVNAGKRIFILNKETENTSSNKAAGLYNPITGRNMLKTWLADQLFPNLESNYRAVEKLLGETFLFPKTIYRPFYSIEEQNDWQGRAALPDYAPYIKKIHDKALNIAGVDNSFGGLELNLCGYVDLPLLIAAAKKYFTLKGEYQSEVFDYQMLYESKEGISYKDFRAKKIIFCEGSEAVNNPYSNHLPFKLVKGEILDIKTEMPSNLILNRGVFILPKNGMFRVGSTYDHSVLNYEPSLAGQKNIQERLKKLYHNSYEIVNHTAGVRPATFDRKPFIGLSGSYQNIGIFNGFGTKGVSLIPFFATQYVNYLLSKGDLNPEVDLKRVV